MKIAMSGATGFIGTYLTNYFTAKGHQVLPINRKILNDTGSALADTLSQCEVVINLAGASINHRWTEAYKKELIDSRIITTRKIVEAINQISTKPKVLISTSAVGYYPSEGCYDEYNAVKGNSFLSDLCEQWEHEAKGVSQEVRLVITRFGVVFADKGGAFEKLAMPAKRGLATIIGSGQQPFAWIDIADHARAMEHVINNASISGVVNFVAPEHITNAELTKTVAKHYRSFLTVKAPAFIFQLIFGEASQFMIQGQCVTPQKLLETGFEFKSPTIEDFCASLPK